MWDGHFKALGSSGDDELSCQDFSLPVNVQVKKLHHFHKIGKEVGWGMANTWSELCFSDARAALSKGGAVKFECCILISYFCSFSDQVFHLFFCLCVKWEWAEVAVSHCCVSQSRLTLGLCFLPGKVKRGAGGAASGSSQEIINREEMGEERAGLRDSI